MKNVILIAGAMFASVSMAQTTLGSLTFNDNQFGDTVSASDGGSAAASNHLNIVNADPGLVGSLTGANFDTGIANISDTVYTIGYNTPIVNGVGDDFGIVVARFSDDDVQIALSKDGSTFGSDFVVDKADFSDSGEQREYYYQNAGPYGSDLFYIGLDLSNFGFAANESMLAIEIGSNPNATNKQLDLVRVAGLEPVPEPATLTLLGLGALAVLRRRKKKA